MGGMVVQAKGYVWMRRRQLGAARGGGGGRAAAGARGGVGLWCVIIVDVVLWQVRCNMTREKK